MITYWGKLECDGCALKSDDRMHEDPRCHFRPRGWTGNSLEMPTVHPRMDFCEFCTPGLEKVLERRIAALSAEIGRLKMAMESLKYQASKKAGDK